MSGRIIKDASYEIKIKLNDDDEEDWYPSEDMKEEEDYIRCPHCRKFIKV